MKVTVGKDGCVVLPQEITQQMRLKANDSLAVEVCANEIVLYRLQEGCVVCGARVRLVKIGTLAVCFSCIKQLAQAKADQG